MKRRKKNCHVFQHCYPEICNTHNIPMIFSIKSHLHKRMLDFNADRVKVDEWKSIIKALGLDRSLHLIAIRSKTTCSKVLEDINSETKCRTLVKLPVLYSSFIFTKLIDSLSNCVSNNFHLKCLELDGLLLTDEYLGTLLLGLRRCSSIQHLSLHRCPLGDKGCEAICSCLRNLPSVISIDMSGCNITGKGVHYIAKTLEYQNLNRYGEKWKQSLRYRTPDTEIMPGLRRVTLNHNPNIGDAGVQHLIDVLRDDLWLKALDLQNVGLSNVGGEQILNLLRSNHGFSIIDVHNNPDLDKNLFKAIMNQLADNNCGKISEYHWIKDEATFFPRKPSYECRDLSFNHRNSGTQEPDRELCISSSVKRPVRLTKSSVLPSRVSPTIQEMHRTHSAAAVLSPNPLKSGIRSVNASRRRGLSIETSARKLASEPHQSSKWDYFNAGGDVNGLEEARAKLQELSLKLKEESEKRMEAEKQKEDLQMKLEKFVQDIKQAMKGHVLIDKTVMEELSETFETFTGFLAYFSKTGFLRRLQLCGLESSDVIISGSDSGTSSSLQMSAISQEEEIKGSRNSLIEPSSACLLGADYSLGRALELIEKGNDWAANSTQSTGLSILSDSPLSQHSQKNEAEQGECNGLRHSNHLAAEQNVANWNRNMKSHGQLECWPKVQCGLLQEVAEESDSLTDSPVPVPSSPCTIAFDARSCNNTESSDLLTACESNRSWSTVLSSDSNSTLVDGNCL